MYCASEHFGNDHLYDSQVSIYMDANEHVGIFTYFAIFYLRIRAQCNFEAEMASYMKFCLHL